MGKGITRGNKDKAGGIINPSQNWCFVEGYPIARKGDSVAAHAPCDQYHPQHCSAIMSEGSQYVFVDNIGVCRQGDKASCGHIADGSSYIFAD